MPHPHSHSISELQACSPALWYSGIPTSCGRGRGGWARTCRCSPSTYSASKFCPAACPPVPVSFIEHNDSTNLEPEYAVSTPLLLTSLSLLCSTTAQLRGQPTQYIQLQMTSFLNSSSSYCVFLFLPGLLCAAIPGTLGSTYALYRLYNLGAFNTPCSLASPLRGFDSPASIGRQ